MASKAKVQVSKFLAKVPENNVFWCHDSCVMADMAGLAQAFNSMSDETYAYHANTAKNDFANWVSDVIGDRELADTLRKAANRTQAAKSVTDRIAFLSKQAARTK